MLNNPKRILISAGGTGGHVFPGLALAAALAARGYDIHWMGTATGIESRLVIEAGIPLHLVSVQGVRGKGVVALLTSPFNIVRAIVQAVKIVIKVRPGLVVGLGGFVAAPAGFAAKLTRIPLVIHEQNAVAGTTNRLLAAFANAVLTAFPNVLEKGLCIGNPVRKEFFEPRSARNVFDGSAEQALKVVVVGGSRGAKAVNHLVADSIGIMGETREKMAVYHQTGEKLFDEAMAHYRQVGLSVREAGEGYPSKGHIIVAPFIRDMAECLAWADVVICRAGALTISELAASGVGSVLVPFPFAIDDHQTVNGQYLVAEQAAVIFQQQELTPAKLTQLLNEFIDNPRTLVDMGRRARASAKPHAVTEFADCCETLFRET
ncbi:undecaprenyldiphospho-muramoylpentapeptide beta-N-acetylglucosaminyltransferase [Teredinibacter purpureus]|uniref:undecaprenyldiphospho-muramoylpentapeptide beta-N-acetylglucosaminyltransferase n=1 Tax=Teredinibacter purpureus TaxID=2731756 RepID=UPI000A61D2BD|nr:undecaprenyldiphospho-muramoylpentapeptide beta-N-acetylglucosaminyltransferase [Teredinibacter purpureus]